MKRTSTPSGSSILEDGVPGGEPADWLREVLRYVGETQFGQVTLILHQGRVIEVQKTERRRFTSSRRDN